MDLVACGLDCLSRRPHRQLRPPTRSTQTLCNYSTGHAAGLHSGGLVDSALPSLPANGEGEKPGLIHKDHYVTRKVVSIYLKEGSQTKHSNQGFYVGTIK